MPFRSRPVAILIACVLATAGCGTTVAPSPPVPSASAVLPSIPPSPSTSDAVTASWVKPAANATVRAYEVNLAAKTLGGSPAGVAFKVGWSGGSFAGCSAAKPTTDGIWSCIVDLLRLGVPPGPLNVSFDVVDATGSLTADLAPDRSITYAVVPPRPETKYKSITKETSTGSMVETDTITWTEPAGYATEFRLYGVIDCPNYSEATNGQPCLVEHTQLPAKSLKLIKTVSGTTRSIVLRYTITSELCGPGLGCGQFPAIVLGAYNAYGQSIFAIPFSTDVCYECAV